LLEVESTFIFTAAPFEIQIISKLAPIPKGNVNFFKKDYIKILLKTCTKHFLSFAKSKLEES